MTDGFVLAKEMADGTYYWHKEPLSQWKQDLKNAYVFPDLRSVMDRIQHQRLRSLGVTGSDWDGFAIEIGTDPVGLRTGVRVMKPRSEQDPRIIAELGVRLLGK